jgi:UDP-N-acetylmuramoyl-L-alanyl-D-glutamate--2,6-diaminopimelate ligase
VTPFGASGSQAVRPSQVSPVSLAAVADLVGSSASDLPDVVVRGVTGSSSEVRAGDLYVGIPGARTHGAKFATAAAELGAVALLTDTEGSTLAAGSGLPVIVVDEPRRVLGVVSAFVYGNPAEAFALVGVTGTQGKTTTTQLIRAAVENSGRRVAVIGTMGTWIAGEPVGSALTTPEAPDLHALFAVMRERSIDVCAMEVSSHALVMGRVDGVVFDVGVFLNLGRDHLDFHTDIDDYFAAKAQLFTPGVSRRALVNIDDEYGVRLATDPAIPTQTFSLSDPDADWRGVIDLAGSSPSGTSYRLSGPAGEVAGRIAMPGAFNVTNAVAAVSAASLVGIDLAAAAAGVATLDAVAGRMERLPTGDDFAVIVDYAHKPDAIEAVLEALRPVTSGRLVVVVGAGGDRDRGKRPMMGEIAARLADVVIVTDDNPRSEDPASIRAEIVAGAVGGRATVTEIGDRGEAIRSAVTAAKAGDTIVIAGKGHEVGQEVGGEILPFDDRAVAAEVLRELAQRDRP